MSRAAGRPPAEREPWQDPSLVLGASGPARVSSDGGGPGFVPAPLLGSTFLTAAAVQFGDVVDAQVRQVLGEVEPLLWQDDGDQA